MGHGSKECSADPSSDVSMAARDPQFTVRFDKGQGDSLGSSPGHCDPQQAQPEQLCPATGLRAAVLLRTSSAHIPKEKMSTAVPSAFSAKTTPEPCQFRGTGHHSCLIPLPTDPCAPSARAASPPQHTSSLHKPFPLIPLKFAQKYSRRGSHHKFSHGKKTFYSFFPNCCNFLHF